LAAIGALVTLLGCFLPWFTVGGDLCLPPLTGNAFEGLGILVFAAAIATLALVTLPYASERPVKADRWSSYAIIVGVGIAGYLYRIVELASIRAFDFPAPADLVTRVAGLWVAGIGLAILARATYEMLQEPRLR